jgi:hypothetical protein
MVLVNLDKLPPELVLAKHTTGETATRDSSGKVFNRVSNPTTLNGLVVTMYLGKL